MPKSLHLGCIIKLLGKFFLALAVGYAFLPFDLIPDFIPVLGHLDDVIIIPLFVIIALKFIPREIIQEYKKQAYNLKIQ